MRGKRFLIVGAALWLWAGFGTAASGAKSADPWFPGFADSHTAGLWLFDEPLTPNPHQGALVSEWDYTRTLFDASENMYDLNRLDGADLVPGRFGRALRINAGRIGADLNLAANYASVPKISGIFLGGIDNEEGRRLNLFLHTFTPRKIRAALDSGSWTWEAWIRLLAPPNGTATLFDSGFGNNKGFSIALSADQDAFLVDSDHFRAKFPTYIRRLKDGQWHHIALLRDHERARHFFDGQVIAASVILEASSPQPAGPQLPGLATTIFRKPAFEGPVRTEITRKLDGDWNTHDGEKFSARMRGYIQAPVTGEVTFSTDPERALHLAVDGDPVIYGWIDHAERYRRSPREGTFRMQKGEIYPIRLEFHFNEAESGGKPQHLYWRWKGQKVAQIPASAFTHTPMQEQEAQADRGGRSYQELMKYRFNLVLGSERTGAHPLNCELDEMRISDVARYASGFQPASFSFHSNSKAALPAVPSGPPLMFTGHAADEPIPLSSRRHIFIDDALIDRCDGVEFRVNPPSDPQLVNITRTGDGAFVEKDGEVWAYWPDGYESQEGKVRVMRSKDGVHFKAPRLNQILSDQPGDENAVMAGVSMWGRFARDLNPGCPAEARYKATAFVPQRGICGFLSPDGLHWRRNETAMLLVTSGGGSEWYYDDQRGVYTYLLKWDRGPGGRAAVVAETKDFYQPWPLPAPEPNAGGLLTPWGEMPVRFAANGNGQVYRTRAVKYPWAPDTYVAFIWRFNRAANVRQTELAVSRDGLNWRSYTNQSYLAAKFNFRGERIQETLSADGLVRRRNHLWQWAGFNTGTHDNQGTNYLVRLTQRLDGFVAMEGLKSPFLATTHILTFAGEQLHLNIASSGPARVAILNPDGTPIPGFGLADCDTITKDSVDHIVSWKGGSNLSRLAGRPLRLQFELPSARLFALEFTGKYRASDNKLKPSR